MSARGVSRKIKTIIAGVLNLTSNLELETISDLRNENGRWNSLGGDPAFLIKGNFYNGWNEISWYSEADEYIPLKLYWDNGNGFSENNSIIFDYISKGICNHKTIFFIPEDAIKLRIDPGEKEIEFVFRNLKFKKITKLNILFDALITFSRQSGSIRGLFKKSIFTIRDEGIKSLWQKVKKVRGVNNGNLIDNYSLWIAKNTLSDQDRSDILDQVMNFTYKPLISVILPVYNVDEKWLRKCIDSVRNQLYSNWELCISDDASTKEHISRVLNEYMNLDQRINVIFREKNGHISESSNSCLEIAKGEFIALLDHDDELTEDALFEVVKLLNNHPEADMIYSDEDKIGVDGVRHSPFFKPDWSPDLHFTHMYTCHLGIYRKSLVDKVGRFRKGVEGSQDFDLALRISEETKHIFHIPKVLYHWRTIPESTASGSGAKNYTHYSGLTAMKDAMKRRGIDGWIEELDGYANFYRVHYNPVGDPLVSIIIPTRDNSSLLSKCLTSLVEVSKYQNYEVIIVNNGSVEKETFNLFNYWNSRLNGRFQIINIDSPFNFSALNNEAVKYSKGDLLLFLNNDIEVIEKNWLADMIGAAQRKEIGAVGAYLMYPDKTVQHSGLTLGLGIQRAAGDGHHNRPIHDPGYFGALISVKNVSAVTAACLMVRKSVFEEAGGFDEQLSVAYNDVDLCLSIIKQGYLNIWLPYVKLIHHESKSRGYDNTRQKLDRLNKEADLLKEKWGEMLTKDIYYNPNLSLDTGYAIKI